MRVTLLELKTKKITVKITMNNLIHGAVDLGDTFLREYDNALAVHYEF
jgi:hypothetical protein